MFGYLKKWFVSLRVQIYGILTKRPNYFGGKCGLVGKVYKIFCGIDFAISIICNTFAVGFLNKQFSK